MILAVILDASQTGWHAWSQQGDWGSRKKVQNKDTRSTKCKPQPVEYNEELYWQRTNKDSNAGECHGT